METGYKPKTPRAQHIASMMVFRQMCSQTSERLTKGAGVAKFLADLATMMETVDNTDDKRRSEILRETAAKPNGMSEIGGMLKMAVLVDVLAHMWTLGFFQLQSLGLDEWLVLETVKRDGTFKITHVGEANGFPQHQFVDRRTHLQYLVDRLASEWIEYQLVDLQIGNVAEFDRIRSELSYEFGLKIDAMGRTLLDTITMASGLRATLSLHSSIVTANIPDKNYYDLSGVDVAGIISVEKFKRILDYFVRFANDVEIDGTPLQIQNVVMSSQNVRDIWDFASVVSGFSTGAIPLAPKDAIPTDAHLQIWRTGTMKSLFGYEFNLIPRNTIAKGTMYIGTNMPVGIYLEKPQMAMQITDEDADLKLMNKGRMATSKVHKFVAPAPWAYRMMKVTL